MIAITKTEFESYVPVAKQPEDSTEVFVLMQHGLLAAWMQIKNDILGNAVAAAMEGGTILATSDVVKDTKALICLKAFANAVRRNDVILTPTGFGVVNTDKVAPASKDRVNALYDELWQRIYDTRDQLVDDLLGMQLWYESLVSSQVVATVFCHCGDYAKFASKEDVQYFVGTDPKVRAANHILVQHISKEYNAELLKAIRENTVTEAQSVIIDMMRRFIGAEVSHNRYASRAAYEDLISTLDGDTETYSTYYNSEAYRLNHYTHYANTADDPCYFFG